MITNSLDALNHVPTFDGGHQEAECIRCSWVDAGGVHRGRGKNGRPGGADVFDRMWPRIRQHADETGHNVRITWTTWHATGLVEQSSMVIGPEETA
jgi:hypothetical protein